MATFTQARRLRRCPGRGVLVDFDLGKLDARDSVAVAEHLSSCELCGGILQDLQEHNFGDPLLVLLKKCLEGPDPAPEFVCSTMEYLSESPSRDYAPVRTLQAPTPGPAPAPGGVPPRLIGPYLVYDKLGQGGMGVVYRAQQVPLKRAVALKMISAGHHATASTVARFLREGKTVARLRHPNVVQVYDLGEAEGLPYYSMELVEGGNLQSRLADGPLDPREAASLLRTLALAVAYAHGEGVVHRDLKPANILLAEDGTPKVTDFGLAKLLDTEGDGGGAGHGDGPATAALTATDVIVGTPNYMAPEQAEGRPEAIGRATDVYALGAILYATLTGRPPFSGESRIKTLQLVREADPTPPSRSRPGLSSSLEAICLKCLAKAPARRYDSALSLADDLGRWLNDERPRAMPAWPARLRLGLRRNRRAVRIVATLLAAALALSTLGTTLSRKDSDRPIRESEGELARGRPVTLIGAVEKPGWMRWLTGTSNSQWDLAPDRTFRIHSGPRSLVELLPDPQSGRYRFSAQVRHETSEIGGEVGLFVSRVTYLGEPRPIPIHLFTQLTFNDRISRDNLRELRPGRQGPPPLRGNYADLSTLIYSDEKGRHPVYRRVENAAGPRFRTLGVSKDSNFPWHHLEVIVTPEKLTAFWDGKDFAIPVSRLQADTLWSLDKTPARADEPLPRDFRPTFKTRGGLGLIISGGSASFRDAKVTPL